MVTQSIFHSGINVGLAVGLSFGILALVLLTGIPLCIFVGVYCLSRKRNRPVRTRVVATNAIPGTATLVTSNQPGTSTVAPVPYPQGPVYKETHFGSQGAPPSYTDATALPQPVQVATYTYVALTLHVRIQVLILYIKVH